MMTQTRILAMRLLLRYRKAIGFLVQLGLVIASFVASFILRLDLDLGQVPWEVVLKTLPMLIVVRMVVLALFHQFKGLWRYTSVFDLIQIIKASTVSSFLFAALQIFIFGLDEFPRSVFFIDWVGNIFLLSGVRLMVRLARERFQPAEFGTRTVKRLLIVGAGDTGAELCKQALNNPAFKFKPVAFVDDDSSNLSTTILGVPIAGLCTDIPRVAREHRVDMAVIALPASDADKARTLVDLCQRSQVPVKMLPAMPDLLSDSVSIGRIRDVDPIDLLGRPPARLQRADIEAFIRGKSVLVTGAAGSVGSELARQIASLEPRLLFLLDHSENSLLFLESELKSSRPGVHVICQVGDITDEMVVKRVMREHRPHVVFNAAAHKHVSLMERVPGEAVKNNVGGTYVVAKAAMEAGAETFVLVSTDKAVNPTSVMGATKRLAELMVHQFNMGGSTRCVSVRFGNVLGSNASVVPIFKNQIANGGPVTVTHPDAERFFMSVQEAAGLILQAGAVKAGGETFILDMGEPVNIVTLAETLITLSGLKPYEDIDIVFTGLVHGEKLQEELQMSEESFEQTQYEKVLVLKEASDQPEIIPEIEEFLRILPALEPDEVKAYIARLVPEYVLGLPGARVIPDGSRGRA